MDKNILEILDALRHPVKPVVGVAVPVEVLEAAAALIEELVAERDAAVKDINVIAACPICSYSLESRRSERCLMCRIDGNFEWRGAQKGAKREADTV